MPAEWERHSATWLAWPSHSDWGNQLEAVRSIWIEMMRGLVKGEKVRLLVADRSVEKDVRQTLDRSHVDSAQVIFHTIATVDVWMRDYGPTFLVKPGERPLAFVDWIFNAWGEKYRPYMADDGVAREIARLLDIPVFEAGVVLEGGSIEVNGEGICLTTEQCLLNRNRNPHLTRTQIEQVLKDYLGVGRVIWLGEGIAGDDTDGHIDDIARFVNPTTVVCVLENDETDANYACLRENHDRLLSARDQNGSKLDVVTLPMPGKIAAAGARLPASYANFYIGSAVVLVPVFGHSNDATAVGKLRELFPGREVIGIRCNPLVEGLGTIHCVTQQEPAAEDSQ
jgi:agmatine deiminase